MRAIFLDRDGVICENRSDYVKTWAEFQFLPGAKDSLAALSRLGLPIIVVTNQAAVNRGFTTTQQVEEIHTRMLKEVANYGGRIDHVYYCPHSPEDACSCRKPLPGMLLQAATDFGIDLAQSYMVGDALTDLQAGHSAGCHTFLVLTGRGFRQLLPALRTFGDQFTVSRNLMGVASHILRAELGFTDDAYWQYNPRHTQLQSVLGGS